MNGRSPTFRCSSFAIAATAALRPRAPRFTSSQTTAGGRSEHRPHGSRMDVPQKLRRLLDHPVLAMHEAEMRRPRVRHW